MQKNNLEVMTEIRYVENLDKSFWYSLDKHLPEAESGDKVRTKRGYVLLLDDTPIGLLRYNLFWDNTPYFYRKLGFKDCGGFVIDISGYAQPMELILRKPL